MLDLVWNKKKKAFSRSPVWTHAESDPDVWKRKQKTQTKPVASLHAVSQALMVNQLFEKRLSLPLSWCLASQVQVCSPKPLVGCITQLNVVWMVENCSRESPITSIEEVQTTHEELITRVIGERYLHPGLEICHISLTLQRNWQCRRFSVLIG